MCADGQQWQQEDLKEETASWTSSNFYTRWRASVSDEYNDAGGCSRFRMMSECESER